VSRILISFLNSAQRWDIADERWAGRCDLDHAEPGLWLGRRPDGSTGEIGIELGIADAQRAVSLVQREFGSAVADLISGATTGADIEVTVELESVVLSSQALPALSGEPGVPVATGSGHFEVPLVAGNALLDVRVGRLVLTMPHAPSDTEGDWVRVSDVDSGVMLALGPVSDSDEYRGVAVPFAFEVAAGDLHLSVSPDPTRPVGTRVERRRRWAMALVAQAEQEQRWRPGAAKTTAEHASAVAGSISDEELFQRARHTAARAHRRRRWRLAAGIVSGIGLLAGLLAAQALSSTEQPEPAPTAFYENCDAARQAGVAPILRGEPGYRPALDRDNDGIACER
jgi:hypothetical protein